MTRTVTATAPARIDLAGGWTDVPPYTTEVGGAVCNVAIELHAVASVSAAAASVAPPDSLVRAAWSRAGEPAVTVTLNSGIPVGSGLGGSSAAGVALAAALGRWNGIDRSLHELAELSRSTETETMGLAGGCQDHFAAAYGGGLLLDCAADTSASPIPLADGTIAALESRGLIAFTGESRMSSDTINAVLRSYRNKDPITSGSLRTMAALAPQMAEALADGDLDRLGRLLAQQWSAQRALHATITTPRIDAIVSDAAESGALGTKALGASGGGCVFVLAAAGKERAVRAAVARHATILPFRVARSGVQIHDTGAPD
jgi:D-glycero-alpha-D-manno-heptose-7-phosphate kinase